MLLLWNRGKFPKLDLKKMGTIEKKLTMRAVFGLLLFISYPFCGHTGILKVSLSFLPLCTVFWGTNTYLTDSYFSSRPLKRWLHPGWYRTVLSLSWGEKKHPYVCDLFFTLSLKCFSIPFLTLKLVFEYCVLRHLFCRRISNRAYILLVWHRGRTLWSFVIFVFDF